MNKLGGIVLAGGLSSRMGDFKPLLRIGGETMVSRVVSMMKRAGAEDLVVVTGYRREAIEESLNGCGVVFAHNGRFMETQTIESLLIGFGAIGKKCDRILVSPADVPLVRPETVNALLRLNGQFVRPVYNGTPGHPVLLNIEILPALERFAEMGGAQKAAEAAGIGITWLETDDCGVALDADTKEDFAKLKEFYRVSGA